MKRMITVAVAAALLGGALLLSGCAGSSEEPVDKMKVWGYVTSADKAQLELEESQDGVDELVVKRVKAPGDSWIVVHADDNGKPGMRVGITRVDAGESTDVKVKLEDLTTPKVIVALQADRGTKDKFDFDMMNKEMSADRPYFVDEKEVAKVVTVRDFGIPTGKGTALVETADQPGVEGGSLKIDRAAAPEGAWVVVHLEKDGGPGARVGLLHIPSGESTNLTVKLDPVVLTDNVFVAIHADKKTPDIFDFDMMDKLNSADQPYFIDGEEVAIKVKVK